MSLSAGPVTLVALLAVASLLAGCGDTIVDLSKTEDQIQAEVERRSPNEKVASVECPSDVKVEPREKFTCTVRISGRGTETATLLIRDEDANLTLLSLQPDR
jgi:hypothetical protein